MSGDRDEATRAFRAHRHDVQNYLQLIKAYIQLNRNPDALRAVDRLARWLTSLSAVQNHLGDSVPAIMWASAQCPNVIVEHVSGAAELYQTKVASVVNGLLRLQAIVSECGLSEIGVTLRITDDEQRVHIIVPDVEEIRRAWNNGDVEDAPVMDWTVRPTAE